MPLQFSIRLPRRLIARWGFGILSLTVVDYLAIGILILFTGVALVGPVLARGDPAGIDIAHTFQNPIWSGGSTRHVFGTDQLGRDILLRVVYGCRVSMGVALAATVVACVIGTAGGMLAGFYGGVADIVISRLVEVELSLPVIIVALVWVAVVGPSIAGVVVILALSASVSFVRVVKAEVLVLRESDFVALARVAALPNWRILSRHLMPNIAPSVVVLATLAFGQAVIGEAALSFLGLGIQYPLTSWGLMIADGRPYIEIAWWAAVIPAVALAMLALSANLFGDYLRDRLDPTLSIVE